MPRQLPPLNALRAFEAAARRLSFARAAEELHVTPAAIRQQRGQVWQMTPGPWNMRRMLVAAVLASLAFHSSATECTRGLKADAPVTAVGAFSNMRYTEEHAYGYIVELWRAGDCLFGLFLSSSGLMGDTPTGRIENISYDENTRSISFDARLTMGVIPASTAPSSPWVPSKDAYRFSGVLKKDALDGTLSHEILNYPGKPIPSSEKLSLPLTTGEAVGMPDFRTFSEWATHAGSLLRHRGPKW